MVKSRAKPRQIDVMPHLNGLLPLLHDFSLSRKETSSKLHINLANVKEVDSIGLSILLGLLFLGKRNPEDYEFQITWSDYDGVNKDLTKLNLMGLLNAFRGENSEDGKIQDLFDEAPQFLNEASNNSLTNNKFQEIILFCPKLHMNRQEALDAFSRSLKKVMMRDSPRSFNHEQIIKVFIELAKNTFDHSEGIGIAGLLNTADSNNKRRIQFSYCDTGEGICRNVRNFLSFQTKVTNSFIKHLIEKGSAIDFLHRAFQAGFSTKSGNGINHGMGLTLISQGALGCGFDVLLRDADSIIDLSRIEEPYTHMSMRAKSSRTSAPRLLLFLIEKKDVI